MASHYPNHPPYVPVIKWQQYEQLALSNLDSYVQQRITPCIEIRTSQQHTNLIANYQSVRGVHVTLVDYSDPKGRLSGVRLSEFRAFLQIARQNKYSVVPTLSPEDLNNLAASDLALVLSFGEVALREKFSELSLLDRQLALIRASLQKITISNPHCFVDLLLDMGQTPETWSISDCRQIALAIDLVGTIGINSVHLLSGAYPESLASVQTGMAEFKRNDWLLWKQIDGLCQATLGFGDYGILNPYWTEENLKRRGRRLAIRYTRDDDWLILRAGGNTRNDSIAISSILVNVYASHFKGAAYSFGDKLLEERADPNCPDKQKKCGHYHITEGWNHHITFVVREQY